VHDDPVSINKNAQHFCSDSELQSSIPSAETKAGLSGSEAGHAATAVGTLPKPLTPPNRAEIALAHAIATAGQPMISAARAVMTPFNRINVGDHGGSSLSLLAQCIRPHEQSAQLGPIGAVDVPTATAIITTSEMGGASPAMGRAWLLYRAS
jgi:hypothetical protein